MISIQFAFVRALTFLLAIGLAGGAVAPACAAPLPLGYIAWDVTNPGASGEFDLINQTGFNASGDATWPVATAVVFSSLSLNVHFTNGATSVFTGSYFTLSPDGLSWDGSAIPLGSVAPTDATLTGLLSPIDVALYNGDPASLATTFSSTIAFRGGGLEDGDLAIIFVPSAPAVVAEPATMWLIAAGFLIMLGLRRTSRSVRTRCIMAAIVGFAASAPASATVKVNAWVAPASGVAGTTYVNMTATISSLPAMTIPQDVRIYFSDTCGDAPLTSVQATSVKSIIGSSVRVQFQLPGDLASRTYAASLSGSVLNQPFASDNCSLVNVIAPASEWTTLISRSWTMTAETEGYKCTSIVAPSDMYISAFRPVTPVGDLENMLTVSAATNVPLGDFDCGPGSLLARGLYMSGTGTGDLVLPPGIAIHVRAGETLLFNLHLVNDAAVPVSGFSAIQVQTVDPGIVTAEAGMQLAGTFLINIPSDGLLHTAAGACFATDELLFAVQPRMHSKGVHSLLYLRDLPPNQTTTILDADYSVDAQVIHPLATMVPTANKEIFSTCFYINTSGSTATYGESSTRENCFMGLYETPPPPQVFGCLGP